MRYSQLIDAVRAKRPKSILEVGTWNGQRALEMLQVVPSASYYGFDLFEDATKDTDEEEFNVKPHYTLGQVQNLLRDYDAVLTKGNTRHTLQEFTTPVDFVWLDGGHSIDTIRSDWLNVQRVLEPDAWVFFDDYYTGGIDISKMGCNALVAELRHEVLPARDAVRGGGWVQMVKVYI